MGGIHPAGGKNPEPWVTLATPDCLLVEFGALPDRRDLNGAVGLQQVAVDQTSWPVADEKLRPSSEEVLSGGIVDLRLGNGQDQTGDSMCSGSYVCLLHAAALGLGKAPVGSLGLLTVTVGYPGCSFCGLQRVMMLPGQVCSEELCGLRHGEMNVGLGLQLDH